MALWVLVILYVKVIERGEKSDILATTLQVKKINLRVKINHGWVLNLEKCWWRLMKTQFSPKPLPNIHFSHIPSVLIREGVRKKRPEKLCPFDKLGGGVGVQKEEKRQTSILEKKNFSEHVESF